MATRRKTRKVRGTAWRSKSRTTGRRRTVVGPHRAKKKCPNCGTYHGLKAHWSHASGPHSPASRTENSFLCERYGICPVGGGKKKRKTKKLKSTSASVGAKRKTASRRRKKSGVARKTARRRKASPMATGWSTGRKGVRSRRRAPAAAYIAAASTYSTRKRPKRRPAKAPTRIKRRKTAPKQMSREQCRTALCRAKYNKKAKSKRF